LISFLHCCTAASEQLRQAGQDPSLANLRRLPGCEYQVREIPASGPGLQSNFLVYQQNRRDPDTVEVVQIFFVAGGTVFPMPTLHEVFSNQLVRFDVSQFQSFRMAANDSKSLDFFTT
jgi:hypothetical protein